jgi:hypothetical protein
MKLHSSALLDKSTHAILGEGYNPLCWNGHESQIVRNQKSKSLDAESSSEYLLRFSVQGANYVENNGIVNVKSQDSDSGSTKVGQAISCEGTDVVSSERVDA